MTATFTRTQFGSAKATTKAPGNVEVELLLNFGDPAEAFGGIINPDASTWSLRYLDRPMGSAVGVSADPMRHDDDAVALSALVSGF